MKRKYLVFGIILLLICMNVTGSFIQDKKYVSTLGFKGDTLYVGGSGPNNYTKIQYAINDASDNDTVFVYDDLSPYYEHITIYKSIYLIGENRDTTVIDGGNLVDVVYVNADFVNITGFTIQNSGSNLLDCGIHVGYSFKSCFINNNIYNNEIGIYLRSSNNNTVTGNNINSNNGHGIHLYISSNYNTILGNNINSNNGHGIYTYNSCNNNSITDNTISNNNKHGIHLERLCNKNNVLSNNLSDNNEGIRILSDCIYNKVLDNNIINNNDGIGLWYSRYNTVKDNIVNSNDRYGIYLYISSNNNSVKDNIVSSNDYYGISLFSSCNNTITGNIASNNNYGIYTKYSSNNSKIYHNNLINNVHNAYDECNNTWDDGYPNGGNYWSDYTGEDLDGDGIGDTPYPIPGGDNEDRYPYMKYNGWLPSDLHCGGTITWADIEPGETVYGDFIVANLGLSDLIWEIAEWPDWGEWDFGENQHFLPPGGSWIVYFNLTAPEEPNSEFTGEIKLINVNNESDYCVVDVSLATPVNQVQSYQQIPHFIKIILDRFPNSFPILRILLNL